MSKVVGPYQGSLMLLLATKHCPPSLLFLNYYNLDPRVSWLPDKAENAEEDPGEGCTVLLT